MAEPVRIPVDLASRSYEISVGQGLLRDVRAHVPVTLDNRALFILTDRNVRDTHAESLMRALQSLLPRAINIMAVPAGEHTKSMAQFEAVTNWLLDNNADRQSVLFTVGGGVVGDLGGFCASATLRGIPFVQVPTTLLAQVDSSVGGKTGINARQGKNLIGSFYQPCAVLCDTDTLRTLPRREILAGYAEIAKYGLLGDAEFFIWLEKMGGQVCALDVDALTRAVTTSCRKKAEIVIADEHEQGQRALLNLGHTFAHALEAAGRYDGRIIHGEAVAIGIVLAFRLSVRRGHCPESALDRVVHHFQAVGLPVSIPDNLATDADWLLAAMAHDKKAQNGRLVFILANAIGETFIAQDVDPADVRAVLEHSLKV